MALQGCEQADRQTDKLTRGSEKRVEKKLTQGRIKLSFISEAMEDMRVRRQLAFL